MTQVLSPAGGEGMMFVWTRSYLQLISIAYWFNGVISVVSGDSRVLILVRVRVRIV